MFPGNGILQCSAASLDSWCIGTYINIIEDSKFADLCHVLDSEMQWLRSQCLNSKIPQGVIYTRTSLIDPTMG